MNRILMRAVLLGMIVLQTTGYLHGQDWTTQKTHDGQTTVKSKVSSREDDSGKNVLLIEFVATTTATVDFAKCIALMKDLTRHGAFVDAKESLLVKTLSDNEWLVYYHFNAPWPLPQSDVAAKMVVIEDPIKKSASFSLTAAPSLYPSKKDVLRMTFYNVSYAFQDLGNGKVEFTTTARTSPAMQVPDWMLKGYFPEGPADVQKLFLALAKK